MTLVKHLVAYNGGTPPTNIVLIIQNADFSAGAYAVKEPLESVTNKNFDLDIALNPGDSCILSADQPGVSFWLSGSVLSGANQIPPAARNAVEQQPTYWEQLVATQFPSGPPGQQP